VDCGTYTRAVRSEACSSLCPPVVALRRCHDLGLPGPVSLSGRRAAWTVCSPWQPAATSRKLTRLRRARVAERKAASAQKRCRSELHSRPVSAACIVGALRPRPREPCLYFTCSLSRHNAVVIRDPYVASAWVICPSRQAPASLEHPWHCLHACHTRDPTDANTQHGAAGPHASSPVQRSAILGLDTTCGATRGQVKGLYRCMLWRATTRTATPARLP
jgi:hypothetical protein